MSAVGSAIGVDVGGSFTGAVVIDDGKAWRAKSPSTYPDVGRGVMDACRLAAAASGRTLADLLPHVTRFGRHLVGRILHHPAAGHAWERLVEEFDRQELGGNVKWRR